MSMNHVAHNTCNRFYLQNFANHF